MNMTVQEATKQADKVLELHKNMDKAFGHSNSQEHLRIAISAGVADAHNEAYEKGYADGRNSIGFVG